MSYKLAFRVLIFLSLLCSLANTGYSYGGVYGGVGLQYSQYLGPGKYKMTCLWAAYKENDALKWNESNTVTVIKDGVTKTVPNGKAVIRISNPATGQKISEQDAPGAWGRYETDKAAGAASHGKSTRFTLNETSGVCVFYYFNSCITLSDGMGTGYVDTIYFAEGGGLYVVEKAYANITGYRPGSTYPVPEEDEEDPEKLKTFVVAPEKNAQEQEIIPSAGQMVKIIIDPIAAESGTGKFKVTGAKHQLWGYEMGVLTKVSSTLEMHNYLSDGRIMETGTIADVRNIVYIQPLEKGEITASLTCEVDGLSDTDTVKIKVEECASCESQQCAPGEPKCNVNDDGSASASFPVGSSATDSYNGDLSLSIPSAPNGNIMNPSSLIPTIRPSDSREVLYADLSPRMKLLRQTASIELDVNTLNMVLDNDPGDGESSPIRQIKTDTLLIDITVIDDYKYQIKYYSIENVGPKNEIGKYTTTGEPFRVITVEDPDRQETTAHVKITNTLTVAGQTSSTVEEFIWNNSNCSWDYRPKNGIRTESSVNSAQYDANSCRDTYKVIRDASGNIVYREKFRKKLFSWGEETIQRVIDPDGRALTTTYSYYDNNASDGVSFGSLKSIIYQDGSWVRYTYGEDGRLSKTITPFNNSLITDDETLCHSVETVYDDVNNVTGTITRVLGVEISRSYEWEVSPFESRSIQCTEAGAAYDAASNRVTVRRNYAAEPFAGKPRSVSHPDGTLELFEYDFESDFLAETYYRGASNANGDTVTSGTKTIIRKNLFGREIYRRTYDIETGMIIAFSSASAVDELGRSTAVQGIDGTTATTVYGCCGPARTTDKAGTETVYGYDDAKRLSYTKTDGITTLYTYDAMDRETGRTLKSSSVAEISTATEYNAAGETVSTTDPLGSKTTYAETCAEGRKVSTVTYPDGSVSVQKYYKSGSPSETSGTAVRGRKTEYSIEDGELVTKSYPTDKPAEWVKTYTDFQGRPYKMIYADNSEERTYFDQYGRACRTVSPAGITMLMEYDSLGRKKVQALDFNRNGTIDYSGMDNVIKYEYSYVMENGKIYQKTVIKGCQTDNSSTETVLSETLSAVDGLSTTNNSFNRTSANVTTYTGNGGMTVVSTNPDGSTATNTYSDGKLLTSAHSVLGTTTYTYDAFNRIHTASNNVNGAQRVLTYAYDAGNRLTSITDAAGRTSTFTYDAMGRKITAALPGGRTVHYRYWPTGELKEQFGSDVYPQRFSYDPAGRMKSLETYKSFEITGPQNGDRTLWNYTAERGFLSSKTYPDSHSVNYTYNPDGSLATRLWSRGITTTYSYNNAGALNAVSYSDSTQGVTYSRNRLGMPVSITDGTGTRTLAYNSDSTLANEGPVSYTYDTLGRRSSMVYSSNTTSYTYDSMSRLATAGAATYTRVSGSSLLSGINVNNVVNVSKSYDNLDRLTSISSTAVGHSYSFNYTYDDADKRSRCTLADGTYWVYNYDDLGQVTSGKKYASTGVEIPGQSFGYEYDTIGNLKVENRNGSVYDYSSNNVNQYTQRTIPSMVNIAGKADANATVTIHRTSLGANGYARATRYGDYFNKEYTFDNSSSAVSESFDIYAVKYDSTNSRDVQAKQTLNVSIPKTPQLFTYDNDGNMLYDSTQTYYWDAENRLTKVEKTNNKKVECKYDFQSRRTEKKVYNWVNDDWTLIAYIKFVYDGWNLVAELNGNDDSVIKSYKWGEDLSGSLQGAGGVGGLISVTDSSGTYYPCYDGNGNIIAYVDASGNKVADYEYGPFGKIISSSGTKANDFVFRFSTKYFDNETGLYYYGYRSYNPELGRWLNRDIIGEFGGENLYVLLGNNGISKLDYLGREECVVYLHAFCNQDVESVMKNVSKGRHVYHQFFTCNASKWNDEMQKRLKESGDTDTQVIEDYLNNNAKNHPNYPVIENAIGEAQNDFMEWNGKKSDNTAAWFSKNNVPNSLKPNKPWTDISGQERFDRLILAYYTITRDFAKQLSKNTDCCEVDFKFVCENAWFKGTSYGFLCGKTEKFRKGNKVIK